MVWLRVSTSFFIVFFLLSPTAYSKTAVEFKTRPIKVNNKSMKVLIADTDAKRTQGMMFKSAWPKGSTGMLFIFDDQSRRSFWMKNTLLPLSLGFFDSDGLLLETANMDPPKSLAQVKIDRVVSEKPARYVLEVPKGWFKKENIKLGSKLRLL